ncbi:helix-turn-helix domain-containing protein [Yersinia entomophaga]
MGCNIFLLSFFLSEQGFIKSLERVLNISYRERVYSIIYDNLHAGCNLNKAADLLGISSATLKRKLQMENTTFTAILLDVRMNHALSLLRNSSLSISQVSYKSGFYSVSNFCSKFKRYFGLSPKQVSKKLTKNIKLEVLKF